MRKHTKILARTVVLAAAGWFAGCNGTIDKEPNVVLEVATMLIPPVTAATAATGECTFTFVAASVTFNNKPKNSLAVASPFNDIVLRYVDVDYAWDDQVTTLIGERFGVGGTVPANGSSVGQFSVVDGTVLATQVVDPSNPLATIPVDGHVASLTLTFHGTTVSGDAVSVTTGGTLTVNKCPPPPAP